MSGRDTSVEIEMEDKETGNIKEGVDKESEEKVKQVGDAKNVSGEDRGEVTPARERKPKPELLEWQLGQRKKNFKSAVSAWRQRAGKQQWYLSDSDDVTVLRRERDDLQDAMRVVTQEYKLLEETLATLERSGEFDDKYDTVESNHLEAVKEITECIRDLEVDQGSVRTRRSNRTNRSGGSNASKRAEVAAEAAVLEAKLKFANAEAKSKADLELAKAEYERVQTAKELNMAQAKLQAIDESEQAIGEHLDLSTLPNGKLDYIAEYCRSQTGVEPPPMEESNSRNMKQVPSVLNVEAKEFASRGIHTNKASAPQASNAEMRYSPGSTPSRPLGAHSSAIPVDTASQPNFPTTDTEQGFAWFAKSLADQLSVGRLPPPEPGVFTGDPLAYPGWKCAFDTLIEQRGIPSPERIYYLKEYLGGAARETVEGYFLLITDDAYEEAKKLLQERYGDPFLIANAFRNKLDSWPKVASRDGLALRKFADFLHQCSSAMKTNHSLAVLNDDRENQKMLSKLPDWLVLRWSRVIAEWKGRGSFPPFAEFVSFIVKEADIACHPITSSPVVKGNLRQNTDRPNNRTDQRRTAGSFVSSTEEHDETKSKGPTKTCHLCKREHELDSCQTFLSKTLVERKDYVKKNGLCFACLVRGHRSKQCRRRKCCSVCSKTHPTSLHGAPIEIHQCTERR